MKTFEQHIYTKIEDEIIRFLHIDELEVKINFFEYRNDIFYFYGEDCIIDILYYKEIRKSYISKNFYDTIKHNYNETNDVNELIIKVIDEYFSIHLDKCTELGDGFRIEVENRFFN
ncbi:hypothetical protein M0Q50_05180 [bacterium]|jgi:hypothetical protein|nr:hypothetical protein [bacterium]